MQLTQEMESNRCSCTTRVLIKHIQSSSGTMHFAWGEGWDSDEGGKGEVGSRREGLQRRGDRGAEGWEVVANRCNIREYNMH